MKPVLGLLVLGTLVGALAFESSLASAEPYFRFRAATGLAAPGPGTTPTGPEDPADSVQLSPLAYYGEIDTSLSTIAPATSVPNPVTWSLAPESSPLPPGLGVDSGTGRIVGTPTMNGLFSDIVIQGANGARLARSAPISIFVDQPIVPVSAATVYPSQVLVDGSSLDQARTTMVLRGTFSSARVGFTQEIIAKYDERVVFDTIRFYFANASILDTFDISVSSDEGATWSAPIPSTQTTSGNMRQIKSASVVGDWVRIRPRNLPLTMVGVEIGLGGVFPPFRSEKTRCEGESLRSGLIEFHIRDVALAGRATSLVSSATVP